MATSHPFAQKRRVLPPTYLLLAIVVMGALHLLVPWLQVVAFPWTMFGLVPLAVGLVLNLVADANLKKHGTTVKPFEESSALVTTGAYRISRHPMYLGFTLILVGIAVVMGTAVPFVVVAVFVVHMETAFVRVEENMMEARFGDEWRRYKARVRRWI